MYKIIPYFCASLLLLFYSARAEVFPQDAIAELLRAITFAEMRQLNFGSIERPTGTVTVSVATTGALAEGTANHIETASVTSGVYQIDGSQNATIEITAADSGNVPGMSFTSLPAGYNSLAQSGEVLNGSLSGIALNFGIGTGFLVLGGELSISSNAPSGVSFPAFDLTINYE